MDIKMIESGGNNRGQVTIFIIGAVIIISAVIGSLIFTENIKIQKNSEDTNDPKLFLYLCLEEKIKEGIKLLEMQGGYISNPLNKSFGFDDEKEAIDTSYLCYTQNSYIPCINQEPLFLKHLENELMKYMEPTIKKCFNDLILAIEKKGYNVSEKYNGTKVELHSKGIEVILEGKISYTKTGQTLEYENFKIFFNSKFYNLAIISQEIVNQEARFCHFENLGFMLTYPDYNINKFKTGDMVKVYRIKHREGEENFRFAIKSCSIPPGLPIHS